MARSAKWTLLALGFAGAASCGPGLEMMHESNLRFEHCYRLDMDYDIAETHRLHCWRDWTQTYALGQTRDRVEYARRRIIALESGDKRLVTIHTAPRPQARVFSFVTASPEESKDGPASAPAPTSAHAPPPALAPRDPQATAEPPADPLPASPCSQECETVYRNCMSPCTVRSGDCSKCGEDYRLCMKRCFD